MALAAAGGPGHGKSGPADGGEQFFGPGSEGRIRICFATSRAILTEGLDRLEKGIAMLMAEKQ